MFGRKKPQHLIIEVNKTNSKPSEDEVRARKFVLTDNEGNPRAQLQAVPGGAVALTFHDDDGKIGMLLGLDPEQSPTMALLQDGKRKLNVELDKKTHQPNVSIEGSGSSHIEVGYDKTDNASIRLHDGQGCLRASLSLSADGSAQLKLFDQRGYVVGEVKG